MCLIVNTIITDRSNTEVLSTKQCTALNCTKVSYSKTLQNLLFISDMVHGTTTGTHNITNLAKGSVNTVPGHHLRETTCR